MCVFCLIDSSDKHVHFIAFLTNLMCRRVLLDKTRVTTFVLFRVCGASYADCIQTIEVLVIFGYFLY